MTKLIKIDAEEYGLEETKAADISKMFKPMLDKMEALEVEFNELNKLDITKDTCKKAKELRLKYVKVRTGTAAVHKELKAFYLQGGRFVDGWKNAQLMASQGVEKKLSAIEKHFENIEKERIAQLQEDRAHEISTYGAAVIPQNLGEMEEEVWNSFLVGTKATYEAKEEALRLQRERIEAERVESERLAEEKRVEDLQKEKERIALEEENAKLKAEADKKEAERVEAERKRLLEEEKKEKARLVKEKKLKAEQDKILAKEREEKEKIEAELRATKEAHEARLKAIAEKERLEKAAPDKEKVLLLADTISTIEMPEVTTEHGAFILKNVKELLAKVDKYILDAAEKF